MTLRCLVAVLPLPTHLFPLVPIARALVAAGHEVRVATGAALAGAVAAAGLEHVVAGESWPVVDAEDGRDPAAARELEVSLKRRMFTTTLDGLRDGVTAAIDAWKPDVVLVEPFAAGAVLAAEARGVPHAVASFNLRPILYAAGAPGDPSRAARAEALGFGHYAAVRRELGLDADPEMVAAMRYLTLDMVPPSMHFVSPEYQHGAATAHPVRPVAYSPAPADAFRLSAGAARRPIVHVTFGTILGARRALDATVDALRDREGTIVVTTSLDPSAFGPLPSSFRVVRWAAHDELVPACELVVHHGGWGSTFACLAAGVPAVVLPQYADGPVNAAKLAAVGAGIVLRAADQTSGHVRAAVERVLADPLYRRNAERVRDEMKAMPPPERAVELLEQLARTRRPLPATPA